MPKRNWINGVRRKRNKTYAERFIDRAMNDGEVRTAARIVEVILDYIDNAERNITYNYVPTKNKVSSYLRISGLYMLIKPATTKHSAEYVKIHLCETCDGSGFLNHENCNECNSEEEK
tara:strand:+ start:3521 stop:3874 length:354 start_codon:yes stop_codon:yes gene_type:complete